MKKLIMLFLLALLNTNITLTTINSDLSNYWENRYLYEYELYKSIDNIHMQANNIFGLDSSNILNLPIGLPLFTKNIKKISSYYGQRNRHPILNRATFHNGIDLVADKETKVFSTAAGKVIRVNYEFLGFGRFIEIEHENKITTIYAHLHKSYVNKGDTVSKGDIIGEVGSTGLSTGNHLHYEIRQGYNTIDPLSLLDNLNISKEDFIILNDFSNLVQMKTKLTKKSLTLDQLKTLKDIYVDKVCTYQHKLKKEVIKDPNEIRDLIERIEIEQENIIKIKELLAKANTISFCDKEGEHTDSNNNDIFKLSLCRDLKSSLTIVNRATSDAKLKENISSKIKELKEEIERINSRIKEYNFITKVEFELTEIV